MVSSILKAGLKCPELITNLQLRWFDSKDITLAFHVLALHKPQPPIFYTQFAYNFLGRPHSLVLRDLEFTTITGFMKSIVGSYHKMQKIQLPFIDKEQTIELIASAAELNMDAKYQLSAAKILDQLCDQIIRDQLFINIDQSVDVLRALYSISSASTAVLTLKAMCKCYILTNQKDLKKDLTFYQCKDEFYELIARGN